MKEISFIVGPLEHRSSQTTYNKNYGVQRLIGALVSDGMGVSDIAAYDFSFEDIHRPLGEAEQLIDSMINLIEPSKVFGFSSYSFNHRPNIILADKLKIKYPSSRILFGGPAISELGKEVMVAFQGLVDYLIVGMAEESIVKFMQALEEEDKRGVPNLIWNIKSDYKDAIIENRLKYPPENWESVMPYDFDWVTLGNNFHSGHYRVLASMGCISNCGFCSVVEKEPSFQRRSLDKVIEEIGYDVELSEKNGDRAISIMILDQNYVGQLPGLMKALDKASLTKKIRRISFVSRADTLIAGSNPQKLERVLQNYGEILFTLFSGIESYSDKILLELEKGTTAKQNIEATRLMVDLAERYKNFMYATPLIGITPETMQEDILANIHALEECFKKASDPRIPSLVSPLNYGVPMARKLGINRPVGDYLPSIARSGFIADEAIPKDKRTIEALKKYYTYRQRVPPRRERDMVLQQSRVLGIDPFKVAFNVGENTEKMEQCRQIYQSIYVSLLHAAITGASVEKVISLVNRIHGPVRDVVTEASKARGIGLIYTEVF